MRFVWHGGAWVPAEEFKRPTVSTAYIVPDWPDHYNVGLGEQIKGRAHQREVMKTRGVRIMERSEFGGMTLKNEKFARARGLTTGTRPFKD